jgi:hypothetical protein
MHNRAQYAWGVSGGKTNARIFVQPKVQGGFKPFEAAQDNKFIIFRQNYQRINQPDAPY